MFPLVWSGCGQDTVMLLEARLTWCSAGTAEGTGGGAVSEGASRGPAAGVGEGLRRRQGQASGRAEGSPAWLVLTLMAAAWGGSGLSSDTPFTA